MPLDIPAIQNGETGLSVRAKLNLLLEGARAGALGAISAEDLENRFDTIPPAVPSGLLITSSALPTPKLTVSWSPNLEPDFSFYDLQIMKDGDNWRSYLTSVEDMSVDAVAGATYYVKIKSVDDSGNASAFSATVSHVVEVDTVPPATPLGFSATGGIGIHFLEWFPNSENDLKHYEIFISSEATPEPLSTDQAHVVTTLNSWISGSLVDGETKYYWLRAVDYSNNVSPWTDTHSATTISPTIDTVPPATPTSLVLNSSPLVTDPDFATLVATWTANTEDDLLYYDIQIRQSGGNYVSIQTSTNRVEWRVFSGDAFDVRVRAVDKVGNASPYTAVVTHTANADTVAPATPSGLTLQPGFGAFWLRWTPNSDRDLLRYEIYMATSETPAPVSGTAATYVTTANQLVLDGLASGLTRWFWIRAVDRSLNKSTWSAFVTGTTTQIANGNQIANNVIVATHLSTGELITLSAQIKDAIISSAKISQLDAAKLSAGSAIAGSITVGGTALTTVKDNAATGAADPATRINAAATKIDPGKILISGATTLENWQKGGDATKIDGGAISANTITANKLEIGSRNVTVVDVVFEHNKPDPNKVTWTAGTIVWINDAGVQTSTAVSALPLGVLWSTGTLYIYWVKGASALTTTTSAATAFAVDNLVLATYAGGTKLVADYGRTIIDGSSLKTGTITATQVDATSIRSVVLVADAVQAIHIAAGVITSTHIAAGSITTRELSVGDLINLLPDGNFAKGDLSLWNNPFGSWSVIPVTGAPTPNVLQIPINASAIHIESDFFPCQPGDQFYASFQAARPTGTVTANNLLVVVSFKNSAGTILASGNVPAPTVTTAWQTYEGMFTAPANADGVRFRIQRLGNSGTGTARVTNAMLKSALPGVSIKGGSITADKLNVISLSAISADVGTLTAGLLRSADSKFQINLTTGSIEWFE